MMAHTCKEPQLLTTAVAEKDCQRSLVPDCPLLEQQETLHFSVTRPGARTRSTQRRLGGRRVLPTHPQHRIPYVKTDGELRVLCDLRQEEAACLLCVCVHV